MNGKTKWFIAITSALFAFMLSIGGYWAAQTSDVTTTLAKHQLLDQQRDADSNARIRVNEVRFIEILRRLEAIDAKLP